MTTIVWRRGYFDRDVSLSLIRFLGPGSNFVDIGAHFGFFTLLGSHLVGATGRVISIEAMPSTFVFLLNNVEKNAPFDNVKLHHGAAFDRSTELEFTDFGVVASSLNSAFGSRGDPHLVSQATKVKVNATTADEILSGLGAGKVDLVKIDAESSEKFVLAGLHETLQRDRPVVVMEVGDIVSDGAAPTADLITAMAAYDYRPYHWSQTGELRSFEGGTRVPYANLTFLCE